MGVLRSMNRVDVPAVIIIKDSNLLMMDIVRLLTVWYLTRTHAWCARQGMYRHSTDVRDRMLGRYAPPVHVDSTWPKMDNANLNSQDV